MEIGMKGNAPITIVASTQNFLIKQKIVQIQFGENAQNLILKKLFIVSLGIAYLKRRYVMEPRIARTDQMK